MNCDIMPGDKKKVLISFVGNHDPYAVSVDPAAQCGHAYTDDEEGAVLTIIRELEPNMIFLFPSSRAEACAEGNHTEGRAEQIAEILSRRDAAPSCRIIPLVTDNPADPDKCYRAFKECFAQVREILERNVEGGVGGCELLINVTSGTQQMNLAGRLFLSASGVTVSFLRVDNPKYAEDRSARVHIVSQRLEEEMVLLRSIERNLEALQFHTIADSCATLAERSVLAERRETAHALGDIFGAYELLDMAEYDQAMKMLAKQANILGDGTDAVRLPQRSAESIMSVLDTQIAFLRKINANSESETTHNLTDLFFNMQRAFERKNYADVLSRFWRLREGVLYIRLRGKGVTVRNLNMSSLAVKEFVPKEKIKSKKVENLAKPGPKKYDIVYYISDTNIKFCLKLLIEDLVDADAEAFEKEFGSRLEKLRIDRNHTIVAHGMLPVSREDAALCVELGEKLVDLIPGGRRAYDEYPFTKERIAMLTSALKE